MLFTRWLAWRQKEGSWYMTNNYQNEGDATEAILLQFVWHRLSRLVLDALSARRTRWRRCCQFHMCLSRNGKLFWRGCSEEPPIWWLMLDWFKENSEWLSMPSGSRRVEPGTLLAGKCTTHSAFLANFWICKLDCLRFFNTTGISAEYRSWSLSTWQDFCQTSSETAANSLSQETWMYWHQRPARFKEL